MRNRLLSLGTMLILIAACGTNGEERQVGWMDEYEEVVCKCVTSEFNRMQIDFDREINGYHNFLNRMGFLKDTSSNTLHEYIFRSKANEIGVIDTVYQFSNLAPQSLLSFIKCMNALQYDTLLLSSTSNLRSFYQANILLSQQNTTEQRAKSIRKEILGVDQLEKKLYRQYALVGLYLAAHSRSLDQQVDQEPTFRIDIDVDGNLVLNDDPIDLESLKAVVIEIVSELPEEDKTSVTALLSVNKGTLVGVVTDVKIILRDAGIDKINYQKVE